MSLEGHYWTLAGHFGRRLAPPVAPEAEEWALGVPDREVGEVRLSGRLSHPQGADTLLLVIHGVGGCSESLYAVAAARYAVERGMAVLRLNLRGADRRGEDIYHGGLTEDLHSVVAAPDLAGYGQIVALGYSLGGHLALRWATEPLDRRVRAIAAVCPPLDLLNCATALDRPSVGPYRRHILKQLKEIYAEVAARRPVATPVSELRRVDSMIRFDDLTVALRHGFADARDYYGKMSVGPHLGRLRVPALIVEAEDDPMVPASGLRPFLGSTGHGAEVRWVRRAGHLGFPADLDLGVVAPPGADGQIIGWLEQKLESGLC